MENPYFNILYDYCKSQILCTKYHAERNKVWIKFNIDIPEQEYQQLLQSICQKLKIKYYDAILSGAGIKVTIKKEYNYLNYTYNEFNIIHGTNKDEEEIELKIYPYDEKLKLYIDPITNIVVNLSHYAVCKIDENEQRFKLNQDDKITALKLGLILNKEHKCVNMVYYNDEKWELSLETMILFDKDKNIITHVEKEED